MFPSHDLAEEEKIQLGWVNETKEISLVPYFCKEEDVPDFVENLKGKKIYRTRLVKAVKNDLRIDPEFIKDYDMDVLNDRILIRSK